MTLKPIDAKFGLTATPGNEGKRNKSKIKFKDVNVTQSF